MSRSPQKWKRTGLVGSFEAKAENLVKGTQDRVDTYGRYDVYPRVSRPFSLPWLQVTPEVQFRWTRYGISEGEVIDDDVLDGPAKSRQYLEGLVEMRGPTFSRVFDTPGNFYSDRFKHTIGPEATWRYRSKVEDFDSFPYFDGDDRIPGTNEINYALVQRFYSKRRNSPGAKPVPYEFLDWRVSQTYYVDIADAQNAFDPNYSSSFFGLGGAARPQLADPVPPALPPRPRRALHVRRGVRHQLPRGTARVPGRRCRLPAGRVPGGLVQGRPAAPPGTTVLTPYSTARGLRAVPAGARAS